MSRIASFLTPILFATFPLLSLFAQNESEIVLHVLWLPLVICIAVPAVLYGLLLLLTRSSAKAGAISTLLVVAFFYFGIYNGKVLGLTDWVFLAIWLAIAAVVAAALVRTRRDLSDLTLILAVAAIGAAVPSIVNVISYQANHHLVAVNDPRLWSESLQLPKAAVGTRRPDIYVLVPDDYARPDVLKRYFHYDDHRFLAALRKRGFVLAHGSRSPYSDSESNISAPLNLDYLNGLPKILGAKSQDVRPVKTLMQDNRAASLLKSIGYRYVHLDTDEVTFAGGNPHISPLTTPDSFMNLWLQKSVLRLVGGPVGFSDSAANERFRDGIRSTFSDLAAVPSQPGPKFVVFHTLLPHDPYIFGPHGQAVTFPGQTDESLGSRLGMRYYLKQVKYLNGQLLRTIDAIQSRSKTPPVIVLQADEGFQANDTLFPEATMQDIRVKGLSAFYMPGLKRPRVPQDLNTVNSLRFLFDRYFGAGFKMLPSRSSPELDYPYQFEPIRVR